MNIKQFDNNNTKLLETMNIKQKYVRIFSKKFRHFLYKKSIIKLNGFFKYICFNF